MKRKGITTLPLVMIGVGLFIGAAVGGVTGDILSHGEDRSESIEDQIDQFHRVAMLNENPSVAEEQVAGMTAFVMLRSEHCGALVSYILQEDLNDRIDDEEDVEDEAENIKQSGDVDYDTMDELFYINTREIRELHCESSGTVLSLDSLQNLADISSREMAAMVVMGAGDALCSAEGGFWAGLVGGVTAGAAVGAVAGPGGIAAGALSGAIVGSVGGTMVGGVGGGICEMLTEEDLTMWEADDEGGMEGRFGAVEFEYPATADQPLYITAATPVMTNEIPPQAEEEDAPWYWGNNHLFFAPDPRVAHYAESSNEVSLQDSLECEDYPLAANVPYMRDVPIILDRGETLSDADFYGVSSRSDNEYCGDADGGWGVPSGYQFAVCPGSEGRIQANKGEPTHESETTHDEFDEYHHILYPYVQTDGRTHCLDEMIPDAGTHDRGERDDVDPNVPPAHRPGPCDRSSLRTVNEDGNFCGLEKVTTIDYPVYRIQYWEN